MSISDRNAVPAVAIRVALVNDYMLVLSGIAAMLKPFADRVVVVEVDSNARVLSDVDVVLYDTFAQTQGDGVPEVASLCSSPSARLVVYTWNVSATLVEETRLAGASGLVAKDASADELVEALERVHRGESVFPSIDTAGGGAVEALAGRWPGDEHGLSARESEVLALICQGLSNAEIGERAYLGINTIKTYIRSTYRKIDVATRPQAVLWGLTHGFEPDRKRHTLPGGGQA